MEIAVGDRPPMIKAPLHPSPVESLPSSVDSELSTRPVCESDPAHKPTHTASHSSSCRPAVSHTQLCDKNGPADDWGLPSPQQNPDAPNNNMSLEECLRENAILRTKLLAARQRIKELGDTMCLLEAALGMMGGSSVDESSCASETGGELGDGMEDKPAPRDAYGKTDARGKRRRAGGNARGARKRARNAVKGGTPDAGERTTLGIDTRSEDSSDSRDDAEFEPDASSADDMPDGEDGVDEMGDGDGDMVVHRAQVSGADLLVTAAAIAETLEDDEEARGSLEPVSARAAHADRMRGAFSGARGGRSEDVQLRVEAARRDAPLPVDDDHNEDEGRRRRVTRLRRGTRMMADYENENGTADDGDGDVLRKGKMNDEERARVDMFVTGVMQGTIIVNRGELARSLQEHVNPKRPREFYEKLVSRRSYNHLLSQYLRPRIPRRRGSAAPGAEEPGAGEPARVPHAGAVPAPMGLRPPTSAPFAHEPAAAVFHAPNGYRPGLPPQAVSPRDTESMDASAATAGARHTWASVAAEAAAAAHRHSENMKASWASGGYGADIYGMMPGMAPMGAQLSYPTHHVMVSTSEPMNHEPAWVKDARLLEELLRRGQPAADASSYGRIRGGGGFSDGAESATLLPSQGTTAGVNGKYGSQSYVIVPTSAALPHAGMPYHPVYGPDPRAYQNAVNPSTQAVGASWPSSVPMHVSNFASAPAQAQQSVPVVQPS